LFVGDLELADEIRIRLGQLRFAGMAPQPIEIVEPTHRLIKDMNDDIGKIHEHPVAALYPFDRERSDPFVDSILLEALRYALDLPVGTPGTNDEIVGNGCELMNVQDDQVAGFPIEGEARQEQGFFPRIDLSQGR